MVSPRVSLRVSLRALWLAAPLVLIVAFLILAGRAQRAVGTSDRLPAAPAAASQAAENRSRPEGRLVVLILDSLRRSTMEQPGVMPELLALSERPDVTVLDVNTCASNMSLPCIRTIFSGRQSPMAAGIEEFTGYGASQHHLADAAAAQGLGVAVVGYNMLPTLFGKHARTRYTAEPLHLPWLEGDEAVVEEARKSLRDPAIDVVLLHTVGTDHVTHYDLAGTPGYARHFKGVDAAVAKMVGDLDLSRDSLVIMGDHGHSDDGHHVRGSIAIFAGRPYQELFRAVDVPGRKVEQTDLLYLLSYPDLLPLNAGYEGRFFRVREANPRLDAFLDLQRRNLAESWQRESLPSDERTVAARMRPDWQAGNDQQWASLLGALPLLGCLLFWVAWTYEASPERRLSPWPALGAGTLAVATWLVQRAGIVPPAALAVVPLAAAAALSAWRRSWRVPALLALLLAAAVVTAAIEPAWRTVFHSRDEFHWRIPLFFVLMLGAGGLVAWIRGARAAAWPWATQLAAFIALPAGVYYYQFNENPLRAYLIPAALLLAWRALVSRRSSPRQWLEWARPRWRVVLALAAAGLLLIPQDAGGWQWHPWIAWKLRGYPAAVSLAAYGALAAWLVSLLPRQRARWPMAALLAALPFYVTGPAGLDASRFLAAFVVVLFVAAWLAVGADGSAGAGSRGPAADEVSGLMLAAASIMVVLTTCDGFVIDHVEFAFALGHTAGFHTDAARFLGVAPLVALKYASPILALMVFHRLLNGPQATDRAVGFMQLILTFKILADLAQSLVGALDTGEKFFELAQVNFLFVACLVITIGIWTFALWAADALARLIGLGHRARNSIGTNFKTCHPNSSRSDCSN